MRKLQPIHTATPRDHCPVHLEFNYSLKERYQPKANTRIKVDRDKLFAAVCSDGQQREEYVKDSRNTRKILARKSGTSLKNSTPQT